MDKNNLLTIGEMSKLAGVSIYSLRYYERIQVLIPAYIDPDTGYRYYSFDQINLLELIGLCVELDIPLKDMPKFTQTDDVVDARAFINEGKNIAIKKLSAIKRGMRFLKDMERQIDIAEKYKPGHIYTRYIPGKIFFANKYTAPLQDLDPADMARVFFDMPFAEDESYTELPEYGIMGEFSPSGADFYGFAQLPGAIEDDNVKIIPPGEYFCVLGQETQIEKAPEIFRGLLSEGSSFIAIETDIFAARYKIYQPMQELRILIL